MELYKLQPAYKDYLWGGARLIEGYHKQPATDTLAESWELSVHPDGRTIIGSGEYAGKALADMITATDLGSNAPADAPLPVMVKLIHAEKDLSVQVHPTDEFAAAHEGGAGKTEMWYILEASEGAGIYCGLNRDVTAEELRRRISEGTLMEVLCFHPVKSGDCFFIPAGTIHAIGAGVVLIEIQQNSNLTYRLYDFNRRDAQGNLRPLHVDKALAVADLKASGPAGRKRTLAPGITQLAASRYFSAYEYVCEDKTSFTVTNRSFCSVTFVEGEGEVGGLPFVKGDSFFAPAGMGQVVVKGRCRFVLSKLVRYYVGVDVGGTDIKGGIIDEEGNFLVKSTTPSESAKGSEHMVDNIARLIDSLLREAGMTLADTVGIGLGVPGTVDSEAGLVVYANNLYWTNVPLREMLRRYFDTDIRITNDASAAALGETRFGAGRRFTDAVLLTIGTGLGSGIVLNGKLYEGNRSAGGEIGHMVIRTDGEPCTCGRKGCYEAYVSATALIREAKKAALADPDSRMWELLGPDGIEAMNARIPFDCMDTDPTAARVVEEYIRRLAEGIANIANILRPQAVLIGGGVSNAGERLLSPLREQLTPLLYAGELGPQVELIKAELGNDAGTLGAAALLFD